MYLCLARCVSVSVSVSLAICICRWICFCIHIRRYNCLSVCLSVCYECVVCISFECCLMTTWTRRDDAACFCRHHQWPLWKLLCLFFRLCLTLPVAVVVAIVTTKFMLKYFLAWNWFLGLFIKARIYYSGVGGHKYFVYNYLIYADFLTALTVCI